MLSGARMCESECPCMQGLPWTGFKAVSDELPVSYSVGASQNFVTSISFVAEEGVSDVFHVSTDLMRTSGFESAFHESDVSQVLYYAIMCNGMFAYTTVWREYGHLHAILRMSGDVAFNSSAWFIETAPYKCVI